MKMVDKGSRGPLYYNDEFTLDFDTAQQVVARGVTLDCFASFSNRLCFRYSSR